MRDASRSPERERILAREPFLERLREERSKSDREGSSFAVLSYRAGRSGVDMRSAGQVIASRLRASDELGWLEQGVLGVLLLGVDAETAARLADELALGLGPESAPLECIVHPPPPLAGMSEPERPPEEDAAGGDRDA